MSIASWLMQKFTTGFEAATEGPLPDCGRVVLVFNGKVLVIDAAEFKYDVADEKLPATGELKAPVRIAIGLSGKLIDFQLATKKDAPAEAQGPVKVGIMPRVPPRANRPTPNVKPA